jgi:hypothetical protein
VLDALQVHRVLSIKRNKTDTNDARGIAEITRTGRDYLVVREKLREAQESVSCGRNQVIGFARF